MFAGWQVDARLGLSGAEMQMVLVLRNGPVWVQRLIDVDQQMMMAGIRRRISRVRYTHVAQAEPTPERPFDLRAVLRPDDIKNRVARCRCRRGERDRHSQRNRAR